MKSSLGLPPSGGQDCTAAFLPNEGAAICSQGNLASDESAAGLAGVMGRFREVWGGGGERGGETSFRLCQVASYLQDMMYQRSSQREPERCLTTGSGLVWPRQRDKLILMAPPAVPLSAVCRSQADF